MKAIIVTGAGGAIGMAALPALAAPDVRLIAVDRSDDAARRAEKIAEDLPGEIFPVRSSLESFASCRDVVEQIGTPIAGLAHLAGVFETDVAGPAEEGVWDRAIADNLTNAYNISGACIEKLDRSASPSFVFMSSLAFRYGSWDHVSYSAAKGGIVGLVRALSRKLAPGCRVNGIAAGLVESPMAADMVANRGIDRVVGGIPLRRLGQPEDIAGVIAFLMSEAASYITGQVINVDGGVVNS